MKNYLFLCHHGVKRSPTAASVAREIAHRNKLEIETDYGASEAIDINNTHIAKSLKRYDKIFVMQPDIQEKLGRLGLDSSKVYCLNIPDRFERDSEELRTILRERLELLILKK